jgi:hypothetical protein
MVRVHLAAPIKENPVKDLAGFFWFWPMPEEYVVSRAGLEPATT